MWAYVQLYKRSQESESKYVSNSSSYVVGDKWSVKNGKKQWKNSENDEKEYEVTAKGGIATVIHPKSSLHLFDLNVSSMQLYKRLHLWL